LSILPLPAKGLAATLQDAAALAHAWEPGISLALGAAGTADIHAPAGLTLGEAAIASALKSAKNKIFVSFGNQTEPPGLPALSSVLEQVLYGSSIGFMAASLAAPGLGRTVYQGHWFQDGRLIANLRHEFSMALSGRVTIIAHATIAAGPQAIRRAVAGCREQGVTVALLDAIEPTDCTSIAEALSGELLTGGPAWLAGASPAATPQCGSPTATGKTAILANASDRQNLYQLAAARTAMPFFQITQENHKTALDWAAAQQTSFILSAATPPGAPLPAPDTAALLGELANGLAAHGVRQFVIAGDAAASAILARLGVKTLTSGTAFGGARWLENETYKFLIKSAGSDGENLFLGGFEPQIRLNAAAECTS
jgi:uncharacterized protein YgbK (DUF1537 family)